MAKRRKSQNECTPEQAVVLAEYLSQLRTMGEKAPILPELRKARKKPDMTVGEAIAYVRAGLAAGEHGKLSDAEVKTITQDLEYRGGRLYTKTERKK